MKPRIINTLFDLVIILFLGSIIFAMIIPLWSQTLIATSRVTMGSIIRSIGITMMAYAEDDISNYKMPYPLPFGKEKVWGNSKDCWSTSVVELMFKLKYFKKGDESQLLSIRKVSSKYKSMVLNDNTIHKNIYWNKNSELDFHLYCDKDLTSNVSGNLVLVATYDNDNIKNCQFQGKGWWVFYSDKTTEFIKRKKLIEYVSPINNINYIECTNLDKSILIRKHIPVSEGGPGTFGNNFGGGSTELMGKRVTDAVYKALAE